MFTHKDVEYKTIFVINCIQKRSIRVVNGELLLEEYIEDSDKTKTLTKLPFQKILALFIIGHIRITTPLIEKCHKYGIALVVLKLSFRPVFYWANFAEANFLLHKKQYEFSKDDISIVDDEKGLYLGNNCGYYTFGVNVFLIEHEAQEIIDEEDLNG